MEIDLESNGNDRGSFTLFLSTAVHLLTPICVLQDGYIATIAAAFLSLGISQLLGRCHRKQSSFGLWQSQIQTCASVACVCRGLASALCSVNVMRVCSLLGGEMIALPVISLLTSACVSVLCALGLERSGILRALLTISIVMSSIFLILSSDIISIMNNVEENNITEPFLTGPAISHSAVLMLGGYMPAPSTPGEPYLLATRVSLPSSIVSTFVYTLIALSLHALYINSKSLDLSDGALVIKLIGTGWKKPAAAVLQTLCLGLCLPEMVLGAAACTLRLCGRLLPRSLARETLFTGTHLHALVFSGTISTILATTCSVSCLVELFCFAHICADFMDAVTSLYTRYQPTYYHKERGKNSDVTRYEMLATSDVMEEDGDRLSEDSGHSSDTDIDAVVAEFRDKVKVVGNMSQPLMLEPTIETGWRAMICLGFTVLLFLLTGICLRHALIVPSVFTFAVGIGTILILAFLPTVATVPQESGIPLVFTCLFIDCVLLCQVSIETIIAAFVWHIVGQFLWLKYGSNRLRQMTQRVRIIGLSKPRDGHVGDSLHILQ